MSFLNSSRHRWKCLVVGFFLLLFPSSDPPPSSSDDASVSIHCCMFAGWQRQTELFKQRGGWCALIWCVCVHATRTTLNKRKKGWQHPTSVCHLQCKRPYITLTSCMCSAQSQQSHIAVSTQQQWKQKAGKRELGKRWIETKESSAKRKTRDVRWKQNISEGEREKLRAE